MIEEKFMDSKNYNDENIDLLQLVKFFLSKIWIAFILVLIGGSIAFCVSKFKMPLKYQSSISMYVKSSSKAEVSSGGIGQGELNVARSLVDTYIVVLQDDTVMEQVGDDLLKKYSVEDISKCFNVSFDENGEAKVSPSDIRNSLSMSAVNSTEVLRVTSETKDPEMSAAVCNIIAEKAQTVLVRVVGAGSVEVIGPAKVSTLPSSPNVLKITIMGALVGFIIAALIIFLIYFLDNTVKSPEEIEEKFSKPVLGEIQQFYRKDKKNLTDDKRKNILEPNIPFGIKEEYKSMRTNLIFALAATDKKMMVVSSANAGEGKSTTAANVAISLAQTEKKVLLIDADLRKPIQYKIFGIKNKLGFSEVIGNINSFEDAVQRNVTENLDVLTSGTKPPNPSELLGSVRTSDILKNLSEIYDYIIIDTPPLNVVSDAVNIKNDLYGMILVLRYAATTIDDVSRAVKTAELANAELLGMVINDIQFKKDGSYYSKYNKDYYSGYENKPAKVK